MIASIASDRARHAGRRAGCAGLVLLAVAGCSDESPAAPPPPPAPAVGSIVVAARITGQDTDTDGIDVRVDGGVAQTIGDGAAVLFPDLAPATHTVSVDGVAANCVLSGESSRTVTVAAGENTAVVFAVTCLARVNGGMRVRVLTPGFDSFGAVLGAGPVKNARDGTVLFTDVAPGVHSVLLHIDAGACLINGPNPQPGLVTAGHVTDVSFFLACPGRSLAVSVTTTALNPPGAYSVYIVQSDDAYCYLGTCLGGFVNPTGSIRFDDLSLVDYYVTLRGVPGNCTATPGYQTVRILADSQAHVAFAVSCR